MDKNMIKIDELVRQRLSGGEEQERAGAWLHMRDLLDDKMPVRPAGGYNWRRMLTAATGLLLFASLTVGGYKMYNRFRPNDEVLIAGNHNSLNNGAPSQHAAAHKYQPDNKAQVNELNSSVSTDKTIEANADIVPSSALELKNNTGAEGKLTRESDITKNNIPQSQQVKTRNNPSGTNPATAKQSATNLPNNNTIGGTTTTSSGANTAVNNPTSKAGTTSSANGNTAAHTGLPNNIARSGNTTTNNSNEPAPVLQNPSQLLIAEKAKESSSSQDIVLVKQDNTQVKNPTVLKDSMPKVAITEKVKVDPIRRTVTASRDTTSVSKMPVEKKQENVFASTQKIPAKTPANTAAAASNPATANAGNPSASQLKMKSQKSGLLNMDRLNERIAETKFRLGQVKFSTGIIFGMNNYVYNTNSMMGIHIGLREVVQFDEKWSMFAELKYMQRFNRSYTIKDNYWRVNNVVGNEYQANEIEHFFKFSALHTIEMPIAVRYALFKQLNVFAGANLVYNFKINAEEVTRISEEKTYTGNGLNLQTKPSVSLDHFGTRLSAGYMLGLGYQISPAFDVDLRMTRNFWDNAAGSGPRKISDQLLYRPSFQLSIGYKFSQRNKVPPAK